MRAGSEWEAHGQTHPTGQNWIFISLIMEGKAKGEKGE